MILGTMVLFLYKGEIKTGEVVWVNGSSTCLQVGTSQITITNESIVKRVEPSALRLMNQHETVLTQSK